MGLDGAVLSTSELDALDIPIREKLLGDWFRESDLGFIYAPRGVGKTWLSLHMARALATGSACGPWAAGAPTPVLYIDGEMPLDEIRSRDQALRDGKQDGYYLLSHQHFFDKTKKAFNLSDPDTQREIIELCEKRGFRTIFLDNLSTLFGRVRENAADDWRDFVEGWFLELRRRKIAVVVIAHAGRNGLMRGTSKREDAAFWVIQLDPVNEGGEGAKFISRFTKQRNAPEDPPPFEWHFEPSENNQIRVTYQEADPLQIFRQWIVDGLTSCREIAEEMGVSKGTVSKLAKKAEKAGWLEIKHRQYCIVEGA